MNPPRLPSTVWFGTASFILLSGCILPPRTRPCASNPAQQLMEVINEVRAREGTRPVWPNVLLARAAQTHARALSAGDASGHFGSDGSDPLQRITASGYYPRAFGENTATGATDPRLVVEAWLRSPAHRQVLMDPSVDEVGFGGVLDTDPPVWVADFGSGRETTETRCHPWPVEVEIGSQ